MVNLVYTRTHTRSLLIRGGVRRICGGFIGFWFLGVVCFIGGPPSLNLWGELIALWGALRYRRASALPLGVLLFIGVLYGLVLFRGASHGSGAKLLAFCYSRFSLSESIAVFYMRFMSIVSLIWLTILL